MSQVQLQLEKLKEAEEKAKTTIQAIQQEIDESANKIATQNAEHEKQKQELEIGEKLTFKLLEEKYQKEIYLLKEKYQKENVELEAKNWERNANFAKEMTSLKEQLKDKINWGQVDLAMVKKLTVNPIANPKANFWNKTTNISTDGLKATNKSNANVWQSVSAEKAFITSVDFSGPILFYYEITIMSSSYKGQILVGLSSENIPDGSFVGGFPNSYAIQNGGSDDCTLSGKLHSFEWPNSDIKPAFDGPGDVIGCGFLLNPEKKLSIFFTGNGIMIGKEIQIKSTANALYPTVSMHGNASVEANFGDDWTEPFKYNTGISTPWTKPKKRAMQQQRKHTVGKHLPKQQL